MDSLIERLSTWLGEEGKEFFQWCIKEHGEVSCVYEENGLPHPVHFREGMQVRNWLRQQPECEGWDSHKLDNEWAKLVESAIKGEKS